MAIPKVRRILFLALGICCISYSSYGHGDTQRPSVESNPGTLPITIDPGNQQQLGKLAVQLSKKRAFFIGEVHDRLEHHQNQLRVIQNLYAHNPDLVIGVEYFQQPFQSYLDDYIAGRIDEREMLRETEYFKRWKMDFRLIQPIFAYVREKHIPVLALNVSDEVHSKVFKTGMKSLGPQELSQTPGDMQPASEHYLQRLMTIFNSHPTSNKFGTFVEGVLLWDESMADTAARYLKTHPQSQIVVLAGMVHVMYGDGIPERLDRRLGSDQSVVMLNGNDFGNDPGVADYLLVTEGGIELPKSGKLGVSIVDVSGGVRISEFVPDMNSGASAAQTAGISVGDLIVAINGMNVANTLELKSMMYDKRPGERMLVTVERDHSTDAHKELQFEVVLR